MSKKKQPAVNSPAAAPQPGTPEPGWRVYDVQWQVKHGGKRHTAGKTLRISDEDAEPLLALGAIAPRNEEG
jgi:hypothetical protein